MIQTRNTAPLALLVLLASSASGCSPAKRETASLVAAVDGFRRAENGDKPERAKAVEAVKCTDQEVCDALEVCLAVSRPTAKGLVLKREVEVGLADLQAGRLDRADPKALDLPQKLDEASRLLDDGHARMPACDAKLTSLRLKYGL